MSTPSSRPRRRFFSGWYPQTLLLLDRNFDWELTGRWMLYSAVVGAVVAVCALVFSELVVLVTDAALGRLAGYPVPRPRGEGGEGQVFDLERTLRPERGWLLFFIPALGGLACGWLVFRFAPEAEGHGTDAVIRAFHRERGVIRPRVPLVKTLASAITIGTGGSAGREGPVAQIGAAIGSFVADRLRLSERDRRILLVAGIAAGVGSVFRSPLGGAFFAVECLYREDIETEALMPAVVAAITGYSLYSSVEGSTAVFVTPEFHFVSPVELLPLIVFAVVCAGAGIVFVNLFYGAKERVFDRLRMPRYLKPALGGLLVGAIAFFFTPVLGSSYGWLQLAIDGRLPIALMATLALMKMVTTSLTVGSGGSGGVFAPSLVIGGMLGGVFGEGLVRLAPALVTEPEAYVIIGMATFMSATANVPIATTVMMSELTGRYTLLVPLIFSSVVVHLVARRWSLYREQVRSWRDSPAHRTELTPDLLAGTRVEAVMGPQGPFHELSPAHTLREILDVFARTNEVVLPVRPDPSPGSPPLPYSGLVLLDDIQSLLHSEDVLGQLIVARDVEVPFVSVRRTDTLDRVLLTFEETQYPELPVLDESGVLVGFLRQGQVIRAYHRAYLRKRAEEQDG